MLDKLSRLVERKNCFLVTPHRLVVVSPKHTFYGRVLIKVTSLACYISVAYTYTNCITLAGTIESTILVSSVKKINFPSKNFENNIENGCFSVSLKIEVCTLYRSILLLFFLSFTYFVIYG